MNVVTFVEQPLTSIEEVECFSNAIENENYTYCEEIENESLKTECQDLLDFTKKNCGNRKLIEKFFCLAVLKNDERYCNCIDWNWYKITCLAFMNKDYEICYHINESYWQDICMHDIAINTKNQDVCFKIKNNDWRNACIAVITDNRKLCENIVDDPEAKKQCELTVER